MALALMALFHLLAIPAVLLTFHHPRADAPEVALVRIPASEWDAVMERAGSSAGDRRGERREEEARRSPAPEPKKEEAKEPEEAPGQVVETAPGNDERPEDARFAGEHDNRVERETISRERRAGAPVTTPKSSAPAVEIAGSESGEEGVLALGSEEGIEGAEARQEESQGSRLEIPSIEARDEIALQLSPEGVGSVRQQTGSEELRGNSDRFRIQVGEGEAADPGSPGPPGAPGGPSLQLFPSASVVDRIVGAPAPDHVEGVEEGEGTFLNTREWRYASFMNRLKKGVAQRWDPNRVARARDPTGNIYLWKDRYTVLSVTLRSDGSIADIFVHQSSGVDFLDQEAIAAFERAQPFPHPPRGMMDGNGQIHFQFGFFIDTGKVGLRLFR